MISQSTGHLEHSSISVWTRLINRIGGEIPSGEKIELLSKKPASVRYKNSLCLVLIMFAVAIYPTFVGLINDVPDDLELESMQGRIVNTREKEPHLLVEFPDGRRRNLEWPVAISARGGFASHNWTAEERIRLRGCLAEIRGVPLRWAITDRFRVWELKCPQENLFFEFAETRRFYKGINWVYFGMSIFCLPAFIVCFGIFLREKRGNL